jgi:hypothetical protein
MKCPHCSIHFHDNWAQELFQRRGKLLATSEPEQSAYWSYRSAPYSQVARNG